jgi:hypothetical protein
VGRVDWRVLASRVVFLDEQASLSGIFYARVSPARSRTRHEEPTDVERRGLWWKSVGGAFPFSHSFEYMRECDDVHASC